MARAIEDEGHALAVRRPLRLKRYPPDKLPDPGQCVDALIVINDRSDGLPRPTLAISNGASWDRVALVVDHQEPARDTQQALRVIRDRQPIEATAVDLTPYVDAIREQVLRALPKPEPRAIEAPKYATLDGATIASALLEMSEHINRLSLENAELRARVEAIENTRIPTLRERAIA